MCCGGCSSSPSSQRTGRRPLTEEVRKTSSAAPSSASGSGRSLAGIPRSAAISRVAARAVPGRMRPSTGGVARAPSGDDEDVGAAGLERVAVGVDEQRQNLAELALGAPPASAGPTTCGRPTSPRRRSCAGLAVLPVGEEGGRVDRGRDDPWRRPPAPSGATSIRSPPELYPGAGADRSPGSDSGSSAPNSWRALVVSRPRWATSSTGRSPAISSVSKRPRLGSGGAGGLTA